MHTTQPNHSRIMIVTGNGMMMAQPNYAQLQIEVMTREETVHEAQQKNAVILNQVIESLLSLNIPQQDIKTTVYNIIPTYDFIEGKQVFTGYEVINGISVKVNNISLVGTVIDTAVANGANRISSIQFKSSFEEWYYRQALSQALQDAYSKARTIAETMNLPLIPQPIEIVEERIEEPILYRSLATTNQVASTPIEPGQITIRAAVRLQFQY